MGSIPITSPITITTIILCALLVLFIALMLYVHQQKIKQVRKENGMEIESGSRASIVGRTHGGASLIQSQYPRSPTRSSPVGIARWVDDAERAASPQQYEYQRPHVEGDQTTLPSSTYPDFVYPVWTLPSYPGTVRSSSPPAYSDLSRAQSWRTLGENL